MEDEIKIIKDGAETIYISTKETSYGIFCFNSMGDLFLNSDYGFYGFAWRSYGDNFKRFLSGCSDCYIVEKFDYNYRMTTGRKGIPAYKKEKVEKLIALFINELKKQYEPSNIPSKE
jgi:hypothetical protein